MSLGSAVLTIAAFRSSTDQPGCAWRVRAATPLTCGADIDVPESRAPRLPVPTAADRTPTPGAVTSGFRAPSPVRGPLDVKPAKPVKFGFAINVDATVARFPSAATRSSPSTSGAGGAPGTSRTPRTPKNGIVTL